MNLRRGFFRLWFVFSALFIIATVLVFFEDVRIEFAKAAAIARVHRAVLPVDCKDARGKIGDDYDDWNNVGEKRNYCFYKIARFRTLYPEYNDLTDDQLSDRLYKKTDIQPTTVAPWTLAFKTAMIAVGVPLIVLALGSALGWSFAGFSDRRLK